MADLLWTFLGLLLLGYSSTTLLAIETNNAKTPQCEVISLDICHGIGGKHAYNMTSFPNTFGHRTQVEAAREMKHFMALVETGCSSQSRLFLCSLYFPLCAPHLRGPLLPCRSLCEGVRAGCAPVLRKYGYAWPARFSCDRYPVKGMCVRPPPKVRLKWFE